MIGGGTFSACRNFPRPLPLQDFYFVGKSPAQFFFWGGEGEGEIFYCRNLHLDTHHNLKVKQFFLTYTQTFCFPFKIMLGENITKYISLEREKNVRFSNRREDQVNGDSGPRN